MMIDRIISISAMIISIIAVPASGYLSYRYAILGEKRKEWNSLAEPIIDSFEEMIIIWEEQQSLNRDIIPYQNVEKIRRRMGSKQLQKFDMLMEELSLLQKKMKLYYEVENYKTGISVLNELITQIYLR